MSEGESARESSYEGEREEWASEGAARDVLPSHEEQDDDHQEARHEVGVRCVIHCAKQQASAAVVCAVLVQCMCVFRIQVFLLCLDVDTIRRHTTRCHDCERDTVDKEERRVRVREEDVVIVVVVVGGRR